jgi:DNA-directed RNA polymerase specialized sigma24 family protein
MRLLNQLWKPRNERKKPRKSPRKPPEDEICQDCVNHKICKGFCPPLIWINGRQETKELIPDKPISINPEQTEYNDKIHELMVDKETTDMERLELIRSLSDSRIKIIASSILVGVSQKQIAQIAHISQGRISRLYRAVKH